MVDRQVAAQARRVALPAAHHRIPAKGRLPPPLAGLPGPPGKRGSLPGGVLRRVPRYAPTRRHASDLSVAPERPRILQSPDPGALGSPVPAPPACGRADQTNRGALRTNRPFVDRPSRSEEHTSELQPLRHLV